MEASSSVVGLGVEEFHPHEMMNWDVGTGEMMMQHQQQQQQQQHGLGGLSLETELLNIFGDNEDTHMEDTLFQYLNDTSLFMDDQPQFQELDSFDLHQHNNQQHQQAGSITHDMISPSTLAPPPLVIPKTTAKEEKKPKKSRAMKKKVKQEVVKVKYEKLPQATPTTLVVPDAPSVSVNESLRVLGYFDEDGFVEKYQRNNKCSGLKNLRCFPNCGKQHQSRKFCGQPILFRAVQEVGVKATTEGPTKEISGDGKELWAWGRFDLADHDSLGVEVGTIVSRSAILADERKRGQPHFPWYPSKVVSKRPKEQEHKETVEFEFNSEHQGWHYAWAATKYTCDQEHCFKVYVFTQVEELDDDQMLCVGIFESPRFTIYCRRRQRYSHYELTSSASIEARLLYHIMGILEKVRLDIKSDSEDSDVSTPISSPRTSSSSSVSTEEAKVNKVLQAFARHIIEETTFTERISAISNEISTRRDQGESIDAGFRLFLNTVRDYMQSFFKQRGVTLQQVESVADLPLTSLEMANSAEDGKSSPSSSSSAAAKNAAANSQCNEIAAISRGPDRQFKNAFLQLVDSGSDVAKLCKRPRRTDSAVLEEFELSSKRVKKTNITEWKFDFDKIVKYSSMAMDQWVTKGFDSNGSVDPKKMDGLWVRDPASEDDVAKLRATLVHMPAIRIKLLELMEKKIRMEITENGFKVFLARKLLSDGFHEYFFDEKPHPFNFRDPILASASPMALTKQAGTYGNIIWARHTYTDTTGMTRVFFPDQTGQFLNGYAYFEQYDPSTSEWKIIKETMVCARRADN